MNWLRQSESTSMYVCVCEGQEIKDPFLCSVRSNNSVGNLWCFYSCAPIHHDSWYRFSTRDTCRNDAPTRYNSAENHMYQTYTRCTRLDRSNRTMNWMSTRATDQPRLKCFCKLERYQNEFWIIPYPDLNNSLSVTSYWSKLTFLFLTKTSFSQGLNGWKLFWNHSWIVTS